MTWLYTFQQRPTDFHGDMDVAAVFKRFNSLKRVLIINIPPSIKIFHTFDLIKWNWLCADIPAPFTRTFIFIH